MADWSWNNDSNSWSGGDGGERQYTAEEKDWLQRNPNDEHRLDESLNNYTGDRIGDSQDPSMYDTHGKYVGGDQNKNGGGGGNNGGGLFPDWYAEAMKRQLARQDEEYNTNKARADSLYQTLSNRANQTLNVDAHTDPIIRQSTAAFRAEGERARRNFISDTAEEQGPGANIQGERRVSSAKLGQSVGQFSANAVTDELTARRAEIQSALSQMGGTLSADKANALTSQLAAINTAIAEAGAKTNAASVANQYDLGLKANALGGRAADTAWYNALTGRGALDWGMNPANPIFRL